MAEPPKIFFENLVLRGGVPLGLLGGAGWLFVAHAATSVGFFSGHHEAPSTHTLRGVSRHDAMKREPR